METSSAFDVIANVVRAHLAGKDRVYLKNYSQGLKSINSTLLSNPNADLRVPLLRVLPESKREVIPTVVGWNGGAKSLLGLLHSLVSDDKVIVVFVDYGQPTASAVWKSLNSLKDAWQKVIKRTAPEGDDFYESLSYIARRRSRSKLRTFTIRRVKVVLGGEPKPNFSGKNLLVLGALGEHGSNIKVTNFRKPQNDIPRETYPGTFGNIRRILSDMHGYSVKLVHPFADSDLTVESLRMLSDGFLSVKMLSRLSFCDVNETQDCGVCFGCYKKFTLFQSFNVETNFLVHPQHGSDFSKYVKLWK